MYQITSRFGNKESFRNHAHNGIDFAFPNHEPVRAVTEGIVENVNYGNENIGKGILIRFNDGHTTTVYGHLSESTVQNGQTVHPGDLIGYSGNSGHVEGVNGGYHLHFGIKEGNEYVDPSPFINDIQHMNDGSYFVQQTPSHLSFSEFMNQHMNAINDLFGTIKLNFIHLFSDDFLFGQILQHTFQLVSAHAGFIYDIIGCII